MICPKCGAKDIVYVTNKGLMSGRTDDSSGYIYCHECKSVLNYKVEL